MTTKQTTEKEGRRHNSGLAIGGLTCFVETFVFKQAFVLRMKFRAEIPPIAKPQNVSGNFKRRQK